MVLAWANIMSTHFRHKMVSKGQIRMRFKAFNLMLRKSMPFIYVHYGQDRFEIIFLDEMKMGVEEFVKKDPALLRFRLRAARQRQRATLKEWALKLGVTEANLSGIERGARPIGLRMHERIAELLRNEKFLYGDKKNSPT
jgi:hypothetical protein